MAFGVCPPLTRGQGYSRDHGGREVGMSPSWWQVVCAPADCDNLVTSQEPPLWSSVRSLPLALQTSSHLRVFYTKRGRDLACAHHTCLLRLSAAPQRFRTKGPLNSSCKWLSPRFAFRGAEEEWGKSLETKSLPCELTGYFSHKCLWCTECSRSPHTVGLPVEGAFQLSSKFKSAWILRPLWICCSSNSIEWFKGFSILWLFFVTYVDIQYVYKAEFQPPLFLRPPHFGHSSLTFFLSMFQKGQRHHCSNSKQLRSHRTYTVDKSRKDQVIPGEKVHCMSHHGNTVFAERNRMCSAHGCPWCASYCMRLLWLAWLSLY